MLYDTIRANLYAPCQVGAVYSISFSCGRAYIGHNGKCINKRDWEHYLSTRLAPSGLVAVHCGGYGSVPDTKAMTMLARFKDRLAIKIA